MKKLKRVLAVLLTAIMTLAMATTAFAVENQGSLKVTVNQGNTLNGQTVSGSHYAYTVNEQYKAMIATALGQPGTATNEELYQAISNLKGEVIQKFADDFTAAELTSNTGETQTSGKLGNVTEYTFNNLDFGYYLVYQTGTKEIQSSLVSVNKLEGAEVKLKGQAPSIEKTADKETVEIGEVVTYTITGVIPDTTGYEKYAYKIHDTLTDGLDFVKDANGTVVDDPNNYLVSVQIGETPATEQKAQLSGNGNRTMLLDLSQWIRDNQGSNGQTFTVKYYAKVNSTAVVETKNSAKLEYGNDPHNTTMTTPSEAKTPTYPVQIHKFARGEEKGYLAGATFRLYKTEQDAKDNKNAIAVTGSAGSYTVAEDQKNTKTYDMISVGNAVTEGINLKLNGLKAGDYWLVETEAPDGYNGITAPIKITIAKSADGDVNNWTISKDSENVSDKIIKIENTTGTILPGTGGMGTILFTVVGIALVLIVAASFVISRRKRA